MQSCKQTNTKGVTENKNKELHQVLEQYYQERMALYPIEATFAGETKFNNLFPNTLSDEYLAKSKAFFEKYNKAMAYFDKAKSSESDKLSKTILEWKCDITLERFQFHEELMRINQFQSVPLMVGQLTSGSSAQSFKTVVDTFLLRSTPQKTLY